MKKLAALLLILILTALCVPALAANTDGLGDTVARNAELAAFLDGNGNIFVSGLEEPVNDTKARSLVSVDPYRILFFAQADAAAGIPQGRLIALTLDGFTEATVTDDAYAACLDEESVYYISSADRTHLVQSNLDTGTNVVVFTAAEALDRIYDSSIGVIATLVDGAGAYISDSVSGQFVPYVGDAAKEIAQGDGFEVYLTDSNNLYARMGGDLMPVQIDSNVRAWAILGRNVYYLSGVDGQIALRQYNMDANLWNFVLTPPEEMEMQLTASENSLFMLSSDNVVYSVDVAGKRLVNYTTLPAPTSYALGGTRAVTGYRIEAVSGQLNVYGLVEDSSVQPTFTFVNFGAPAVQEESGATLLSAYSIDAESTVWDLLQPAPQYSTLRRGSRGDAVSAIQQPLYDADYYNYYIDGIFGWRTERAVELLQDALGLDVDGIADAELQKRILSGNFPEYDPYRRLRFGDRGLRVTEMQQRLRDLGYLADDADSIFGERTLAAVELFQRENGLGADGIAGPETLRKLYSSSAHTCTSYIELRRGDTGYRVRELNRRLKELYYLEGSAGSTYTLDTAEAVKLFQAEIGLRQSGAANEALQQQLFSRSAPEYSGYITLRRGDENSRVKEMQRRLKDLGYYDGSVDSYFGKSTYQAVRAFQRRAGLKVTGVANPNTLKRLFANDAPEYQPPTILTTPELDFYGDSFEANEKGVYQVPEETEMLTFFWSARGVSTYDITLKSKKELITSMNGTTDEMVGVSTARLLNDVVYTFTVVAHPEDPANNEDASASLKFEIVTEPSVVESVSIRPVENTYTREDGIYVIPGESIAFRWTAYGDVGKYSYIVYGDDRPDKPIAQAEGADLTEFSIAANQLDPEVTYSLTVFAYPRNGSLEDAVSDFVEFRKAVEPLPTIDPAQLEPSLPDDPVDGETEIVEASVTDDETGEDENSDGESGGENDPAPGDAAQDLPELSLPNLQASPAEGEIIMEVPQPDGTLATETVVTLGEGNVELSWETEGDVAGYQVNIVDSAGNVMADNRLSNPGARVNSENLVPDEVYTLTATAFFESGESTSSTLYFMKPDEEEIPAEEPEHEESEPEPAEESTPEPTEEPTPEPTEEPTPEPTEAPIPLGQPAVQVYPNDGEIEMEVPHPDGDVSYESVIAVGEGSVDLGWATDGDIAGYQVTITDSKGNVMVDKRMTNTSATIDTRNLNPGEVYTLTAFAYSNNGEVSASSIYFTRPAPEAEESAPQIEEPQIEEPYYDEPEIVEPEYEEPAYDEPTEESEPEYDEPAEESEPAYDEPTEEPEPDYEEPAEEPEYEEPAEEPEYEEPAEGPAEEPEYEEPEPDDEEPIEEPGVVAEPGEGELEAVVDVTIPIDAESDPEIITALQKRLRTWGWLEKGSFTKGELDEVTVQAVSDFQNYCIESGLELLPIDPELPIIDTDTLGLLFNLDGNEILKP